MYLFHEEACGRYRFPSRGLQNESKTQARYLTTKEKKSFPEETHWKSKIIIIRCEKQNSNREKHVKKAFMYLFQQKDQRQDFLNGPKITKIKKREKKYNN